MDRFGQEPGWWEVDRPEPELGVVSLLGEHDMSTAPDVEASLFTLAREERNLVVDVSATTFLDSSVVNALYRVLAAQRDAGRRLVIQAATAAIVLQALRITGLLDEVPLFETRNEAIAATLSG